jgi:dihydroorotase
MKTIPAIFALSLAMGAQTTYDLLLKGGTVIDPKNRINASMDVAISDGKIARVAADIPASQARRTVDVKG